MGAKGLRFSLGIFPKHGFSYKCSEHTVFLCQTEFSVVP